MRRWATSATADGRAGRSFTALAVVESPRHSADRRRFTPLPSVLVQPQDVTRPVRMVGQTIPVEVDAEARSVTDRDVSVGEDEGVVDDELPCPGFVEVLERLEVVEVRRARSEVQADHGAHRSLGVVRSQHAVVRLGHPCDDLRAGETTQAERFWLQDVNGVVRQQFCELLDRRQRLAGRDRHGRVASDVDHRRDVLVRDGLLEPGRPVRRQPIGDAEGGRRREAAVALDHEVDIGADGVAHGGDDVDRLVLLTSRSACATPSRTGRTSSPGSRGRTATAVSAKPSGERSTWYQPFAYTRTRSRTARPAAGRSGCPRPCP